MDMRQRAVALVGMQVMATGEIPTLPSDFFCRFPSLPGSPYFFLIFLLSLPTVPNDGLARRWPLDVVPHDEDHQAWQAVPQGALRQLSSQPLLIRSPGHPRPLRNPHRVPPARPPQAVFQDLPPLVHDVRTPAMPPNHL